MPKAIQSTSSGTRAALASRLAGPAAQDWPTRPVTMVVPFAAGGPVDVVARSVAPRLAEILGQQVIIENIGGAGGMTGAPRVAKAAPDGYTFVLGNSGTHAYSQTLYKKPLYNAATDFAPVAVMFENTKVLVTRKDFPANTLQEFIAYAKANHDKMQFGSAGAGSATHLGCVLLNAAIGVDVTHVPYRGAGPAMQDLIARPHRLHVRRDLDRDAADRARPVKAIALLSPRAHRVLPDLPTAQEQGLKGFDADGWNAFFLPKGTPEPIVQRRAGDKRHPRHPGGAGEAARPRPHCAAAGAAHGRMARQAGAGGNREMGGAGEGKRRRRRRLMPASTHVLSHQLTPTIRDNIDDGKGDSIGARNRDDAHGGGCRAGVAHPSGDHGRTVHRRRSGRRPRRDSLPHA